jgi:hypothetical protein
MSDSSAFSRRSFFGRAGGTGIGLATLGGGLFGAGSAQAALSRTHAGMGMALEIDGSIAGFLTGASGGAAIPQMAAEAVSAGRRPQSTMINVRQEPVTIYFGTALEARAIDWFNSWSLEPRDVAVVMFEQATSYEVYRLIMPGARVTGFHLPRLNAATADPIEFSVTLLAENTSHQFSNRKNKISFVTKAPKNMRLNAFRFFVEKLETSTQLTRTIDGIAVTQESFATSIGAKDTGTSRSAGVLQFPSFEVSVSISGAVPMFQWFNEMLTKRRAPRAGQLQLQGTTAKGFDTIATVDFVGLQPIKASPPYEGVTEGESAAVKFVLLPEEVRLNLKSLV